MAANGSWERAARLVDLGLGGAGIRFGEPPAKGERVILVLEAPHLWEPLRLEAEIAWRHTSEETRAGLVFRHQAGTTLRAIARLLEATLFG
jgi:hypothetical protein